MADKGGIKLVAKIEHDKYEQMTRMIAAGITPFVYLASGMKTNIFMREGRYYENATGREVVDTSTMTIPRNRLSLLKSKYGNGEEIGNLIMFKEGVRTITYDKTTEKILIE